MSKNDPYFSVWFNTRATIDNILTGQVRFKYYIPILLTIFSGYIGELDRPLDEGIHIALILSAITILLGYFLLGHFIPWIILKIGKIWNGKSGLKELQIVIGLTQIPVILILIEQLIFMAFGEIKPDWSVNIGIQWISWVFYMRILIIGIARVQGFNYGIAILNLVLSLLPFLLIRLIFS